MSSPRPGSRWGREHRRLARPVLVAALLLSLLVLAPLAPRAWAAPAWLVGTDPTYAPFEMADGASGELTGFDVELIRAVARSQGRTVRFVSLPFDGLIPALQAHKLDMAISAMTITPARAETVDFSRPYFAAGLGVVVRRDGPSIPTLEALAGRRVAVQIGSTGALAAGKVKGAVISSFNTAPLALQELINGNVDAYVNDLPATLYAIQQAGLQEVRISSRPLTSDFYGIALPKGSALRSVVDRGIEKVMADGQMDRLHRRWFQRPAPPLPAVAPALQGKAVSRGLDGGLLLRNLLTGAAITLALSVSSFGCGSLLAALLTLMLMARRPWLQRLGRLYVTVMRGTPLLVQLFLVYFGLPALSQQLGHPLRLPPFAAAVGALSLNLAATMAETLRAGITSIDRGQWQAAAALGLRPLDRLRHVILPQALQRVLPPLSNEFITLIKDTSLAAVIGFDELFRQGQLVVATTYRAFEVYAAVALVYLVLTAVAARVFLRLERRLTPGA
jgi:arginine/lysine/histidine/glutamine transport system substrate-binding/permease protein